MLQAIWIPGWNPAPQNELLGHRMKAHRLKSRDAEIIGRAFLVHGGQKATGPRSLDLHIILGPGQRACDKDAYWKSTQDGLVRCSALINDTPRLCRTGKTTFSRAMLDASPGTLILLQDVLT